MTIQKLNLTDIDRIMVIQRNAYTAQLIEPADAFLHKMKLFTQGALGYFVEDEVAGYLFCHPWQREAVVPVHAVLAALPEAPDCFYLHDLSVHSDYRGRGIGKRLVEHALSLGKALGFTTFELVSVQGSANFWRDFGFEPVEQFEYAPGVLASKMVLECLPVLT